MNRYRIGIDVGGTHTDVVLTDADSGAYRIESWKPALTALVLPPVPLLLTLLVGAEPADLEAARDALTEAASAFDVQATSSASIERPLRAACSSSRMFQACSGRGTPPT